MSFCFARKILFRFILNINLIIKAGALAGKADNEVQNEFVENDADEMVRIIEKKFIHLSTDYMLSQKEAEKSAYKLRDIIEQMQNALCVIVEEMSGIMESDLDYIVYACNHLAKCKNQ